MRPSVSVCMATWNGAKFLPEQLDTLIPQLTFGDEVVVVDDGSSDETMEILKRAADESKAAVIRIHQNERRLGPIWTFERALSLASGDILLLCDQDDRWLPGKVERICRAFAEDVATTLVMSDAQVIDGTGSVIAPSWRALRPFRRTLLPNVVKNTFHGCIMAFRQSSMEYCLPIPPRAPHHDQWIGVLHTVFGKIAYIDEPLIQYRRHGGNNQTGRHAPWHQMLRWRYDLAINLATRCWCVSRAMRDQRRTVGPPASS
jgi:glycosyltransferase involved in cell wall biosynthesis